MTMTIPNVMTVLHTSPPQLAEVNLLHEIDNEYEIDDGRKLNLAHLLHALYVIDQ